MSARHGEGSVGGMTLIWFVVWLIADHVGAHKPLLFDPVNVWAWTLVLAIALDLGSRHVHGGSNSRS